MKIRLMHSKLVFGALLVALTLSTLAAQTRKVTRPMLGISETTEKCSSYKVPSLWRMYDGFPNYNQHLVADEFGIYAAFAANAYGDESDSLFDLRPEWFGWKERQISLAKSGGFAAQVFHWEKEKTLAVMVVFRGTDGPLALNDHVSNLSWFTQFLNPWDQYRIARSEFRRIRTDAYKSAGDREVSFLAVGHSLGGGLARHMAAAFPCTTAVAFNSSFVSNNFRLESPYDGTVVDVFEDLDPLSKASLYAKPNVFFKVNPNHQWYRTTAVSKDYVQHGIAKLANASAKIALDCKFEKSCEIMRPVEKVRLLFCEARKRKDPVEICVRASRTHTAPLQIVDSEGFGR